MDQTAFSTLHTQIACKVGGCMEFYLGSDLEIMIWRTRTFSEEALLQTHSVSCCIALNSCESHLLEGAAKA